MLKDRMEALDKDDDVICTHGEYKATICCMPSDVNSQVNGFYDNVTRWLQKAVDNNGETELGLACFVLQSDPENRKGFKSDIIILACGIYCEAHGTGFDYRDIQAITGDIMHRTMTTSLIYKNISALESEGLIRDVGRTRDSVTERLSKNFEVTDLGHHVFKVKLLNAIMDAKSRAA